MNLLEWLVPLLLGAVALSALARRVGAPYPAFLALGGAVIPFLPNGPHLTLEPDLALALFVAPVLLDAAFNSPKRDLVRNWPPIAGLVLVAVAATTAAVAYLAHALVPGLPWAAAITLGAIVAPPDAAAATAVLRQVGPPHRLLVILEGESLFNDATALLIYRLAVGAALAGSISPGELATTFLLVVPGSLLAGAALSSVTSRVVALIQDPPSSIIVQFALTFGIWMLADRIGLSPVLTIIAYAILVARGAGLRQSARVRVPAYAVWETAVVMLNILAFLLIGLQLRPILEHLPASQIGPDVLIAVAVLATVIAVRLAWTMGCDGVAALGARVLGRRSARVKAGKTAGAAFVVGWCGMRGIVTLAAALALPDGQHGVPAFPGRDLILLIAFAVVLGTLVLQGLTLKPLLGWLDLRDDDPVGRETGRARARAFEAALANLDGEEGRAADALRREYKAVLRAAKDDPDGQAPASMPKDELRLRTVGAAREALVGLRRNGEIGDDAFQRVEEELDRAEMHARAD